MNANCCHVGARPRHNLRVGSVIPIEYAVLIDDLPDTILPSDPKPEGIEPCIRWCVPGFIQCSLTTWL